MGFQWDPAKARATLRKHRVDFADAVGVFEDLLALTLDDPHPDEDRFLTLGVDLVERVIVVNWTWRDDDIRLVSERKANPKQRRQYAEGHHDA